MAEIYTKYFKENYIQERSGFVILHGLRITLGPPDGWRWSLFGGPWDCDGLKCNLYSFKIHFKLIAVGTYIPHTQNKDQNVVSYKSVPL